MINLNNIILEGGGARGAFTAGVVDYLIEKNVETDNLYGVSAGAVNACHYLSKQYRRVFSWKQNEVTGMISQSAPIHDVDLLEELTRLNQRLIAYDIEKLKSSKTIGCFSVMDAETGRSEYIPTKRIQSESDLLRVVAASCAIPGFAKPVLIGEKIYFDGGFDEAIPFQSVLDYRDQGSLYVLTQPDSYRKKQDVISPELENILSDYPMVLQSMKQRHHLYNDTLEKLKECEKSHSVVVIRPCADLSLETLDFDWKKMLEWYHHGVDQCKKAYISLMALKKDNE